jgi:plasmid maintenance system antidote protein VapI
MSTLSEYIKTQPQRPMREWAEAFGISRPYLIALIKGDRTPGIDVAQRIERATGGFVRMASWPNIRAISEALSEATHETR